MLLKELLSLFPAARLRGEGDIELTGLSADSRQIQPGWLFVAVTGLVVDGHDFVAQAEARGAAALMVEHPVESRLPQLIVARTQALTGLAAAAIQANPSRSLRVTGFTGTKGKTSSSYLLDHLLRSAGRKASLVGSVGGRVAGQTLSAGLTTRAADELQVLMRRAVEAGDQHWVMEVGSHSLVQRRVAGIEFDTAIFTNFAHDHLDYHGTMENYLAAKALLFSWLGSGSDSLGLKGRKLAVLNRDDPSWEQLRDRCGVPLLTYGFTAEADLWADRVHLGAQGSRFCLHWQEERFEVALPLVGRFNIANALAALSGGLAEGLAVERMIADLAAFPGVPGRFQRLDCRQPFSVIIDYAHTEDSLRQVLLTAREMTSGRLILVFGCTGDRDRSKRPIMGELAVRLADRVIISSDDPHSENPDAIIDEIVAGLPAQAGNWQRQADRSTAVAMAIAEAEAGDTVLLAGKGHETVQIFNDVQLPYSDYDAALTALRERGYAVQAEPK